MPGYVIGEMDGRPGLEVSRKGESDSERGAHPLTRFILCGALVDGYSGSFPPYGHPPTHFFGQLDHGPKTVCLFKPNEAFRPSRLDPLGSRNLVSSHGSTPS